MEFIEENYIWLIIIAVIVVMTIIGYIADKTDFGKNKTEKVKKEKTKKEKKSKKEKQKETEKLNEEEMELPIELPKDDIDIAEDFPIDLDEENIEPAFNTDEMDLEKQNIEPQVDETSNNEIEEPIYAESTSEEPSVEEPISEDLYVGLDGTPNTYKDDSLVDGLVDEKENLEIELPSIDTLDKELEEEIEDDDVWKF